MNKYNITVNKAEDGSYLPRGTIAHPRYEVAHGRWNSQNTHLITRWIVKSNLNTMRCMAQDC